MEKFAISKANRFLEQGNYLVLPVLEIIYVWNQFDIFGKSEIMTKKVDEMIDQCLDISKPVMMRQSFRQDNSIFLT